MIIPDNENKSENISFRQIIFSSVSCIFPIYMADTPKIFFNKPLIYAG